MNVKEPGEYVIGRSRDAPLRVDNETVSRRHALLRITADRARVEVEHAGGSNGTRVNGVEIQTAVLKDGDVIQLGELPLKVGIVLG